MGESTDDQNMVAILEPSHMAVFGKTVRIKRPGEDEPFLTVKVRMRRLRPARASRPARAGNMQQMRLTAGGQRHHSTARLRPVAARERLQC